MQEETPRTLKIGLAEMLKGGVIMDVTTAEQAKIAENAGAVAVMALERVPADIRTQGGLLLHAFPRRTAPPEATPAPLVFHPCNPCQVKTLT